MKYCTFNMRSTQLLKIVVFLVLSFKIQIANAQTPILDKEISIDFNNESLSEALAKIETQFEGSFSYAPESLKTDKRITKKYIKVSVRELLNELFKEYKIYYRVRGNTIHIQTEAEKVKIKGRTSSLNGASIPFVSIILEGTTFGSSSDEDGNFNFYAPEGEYVVIASSIGYETQKKAVVISGNIENNINFQFKESSTQLQEVEIIGRKAKTYKNDQTFVATKTATKVKDIPQAISYVTKEVMADQQAYRVNDVIKNVSGVNQYSWYDDFSMRGFRSGETYINGLRVIGLFGPQPLLANIERVEVLKGPASAMFGNANPGGTMNRVTKKPLSEDRKAVSFTTGSFNTLRSTLDFTGAMNENKTLLYRLNIAYENSGSFRNLQETKSYLIAPSITFLPTENTKINFDFVIQNFDGKLDRGQPIYGATAGTSLNDPNNTPISFAIGATNDYHKSNVDYFTLSLNHKFNENISFNSSYMRYANDEDLWEHRTSNKFAVDGDGNEIPTLMGMRILARKRKTVADNVTNYFVVKTKTGKLDHKILIGFDYAQKTSPLGGAFIWTRGGGYLKNDGTVAAYDPANKLDFKLDANGNPVPNVPHFDLVNPTYKLAYPSDYVLNSRSYSAEKYSTTGYYIQDQIKWNKLQLLVGGRLNYYNNYTDYNTNKEKKVVQKKFIPRIGLVYGISNEINLYGTYTESFEPQIVSAQSEIVGGPFDPLESNMIEFGAKGEFLNKKLTANLAIYSIKQKNELLEDPNDANKFVQLGETSSKGFELDVLGRVNSNISITANYAYNNAKFESTPASAAFKKGERLPNAPKHQGGVFGKYKINRGQLKGVSFNLNANFVGERNTRTGASLKLPSYTIFDMGATYEVDKFVLRFTLNNVFNKTHWVGGYSYNRLFPGAPRNYLLSVGYTF